MRFAVLVGMLVGLVPGFAHAETERGSLVIDCPVDGATVYIDGARRGRTPIAPVWVPAGAHDIRVTKPGYRDFALVVEVRQGYRAAVFADLTEATGVLVVTAEADGLRVLLNGRDVGVTPLRVELPIGAQVVTVLSPHAGPYVERVEGKAGATVEIHAPRGGPDDVPEALPLPFAEPEEALEALPLPLPLPEDEPAALPLPGFDDAPEPLPLPDLSIAPREPKDAEVGPAALATSTDVIPPPPSTVPWYKNGWFIGGTVGAAVVAGAVAAAVVLTRDDGDTGLPEHVWAPAP